MTERRRQFREIEVIETLLLQGAVILCKRCGQPLTLEDARSGNIEKEHVIERALGGADLPTNCIFSHKAAPCHHTVTNGNGATTAGSSKNRIAKATQPARIAKFQVNKTPLDADTVGRETGRCRRCGEYPDGCSCTGSPRRQPFAGPRR